MAASRLVPGPPVPLSTGLAEGAAFGLAVELRSPGLLLPFLALDVSASPGLLAVPRPSDFMVPGAGRWEAGLEVLVPR